jgi:hypothetical protein
MPCPPCPRKTVEAGDRSLIPGVEQKFGPGAVAQLVGSECAKAKEGAQ